MVQPKLMGTSSVAARDRTVVSGHPSATEGVATILERYIPFIRG
jgi:hypothetical protein